MFSSLRRREDSWNSVIAGGLSSSILVLRSGMKTVVFSFFTGAILLGVIEGAMILLQNSIARKQMDYYRQHSGMDGIFIHNIAYF